MSQWLIQVTIFLSGTDVRLKQMAAMPSGSDDDLYAMAAFTVQNSAHKN